MALPDPLTIEPVDPFDVALRVPGSKSLTNRALLLAALAEGESRLTGVLFADDSRRMIEALQQLEVPVETDRDAATATLTGCGGSLPAGDAELFLGNAGTAIRFLTAACCLGSGGTRGLDGIPRMRQRPIGTLVDTLRSVGGEVRYRAEAGYPPVEVEANGLFGGEILMPPTLSSQYISALLQVGPCCEAGLTISFGGPVISRPYVEMTVNLMRRFGAQVEVAEDFSRIRVSPGVYRALDYEIEPDASSASYFLAAAAIVPGSRCTIEGLGSESVQGDARFAGLLGTMGAEVTLEPRRTTVAAPKQDRLQGIDADLNAMPDMAQTLAAAAVFAEGPTTIRHVGNLRVKETDRMAALQAELSKLGAEVQITGDDIHITPPPGGQIAPAAIDTYDDHRMAMSFAVIGLAAEGVSINDPGCVAKTYPDFFDHLERLGARAGAAE
ncbi:MAG: 3-phosphoshikimate 1-carboxyvinyltransferase [Phycisphaeraceae bacterium]